nr:MULTISPECIES: PE family protein [Mycobacterium]
MPPCFGEHAQSYQALSAQAAAFHRRFVDALSAPVGFRTRPRKPLTPRTYRLLSSRRSAW